MIEWILLVNMPAMFQAPDFELYFNIENDSHSMYVDQQLELGFRENIIEDDDSDLFAEEE